MLEIVCRAYYCCDVQISGLTDDTVMRFLAGTVVLPSGDLLEESRKGAEMPGNNAVGASKIKRSQKNCHSAAGYALSRGKVV